MSAQTKHTQGPWKDGPLFQREGRAIFWTDTSKGGKWNRRLDDKGEFAPSDARLCARAPSMVGLLEEIFDELGKYEDVVDGPNGEQRPNWAMQLRSNIVQELLAAGVVL